MGLGLAPSGSQDGTLTTLAITGISPSTGTTGGGTAVTITGRGFELGMTAKIDGVLCTSLVVTSANTLTCVTPAGTVGAQDVRLDRVTTAANATLAAGFTYAYEEDWETRAVKIATSFTLAVSPTVTVNGVTATSIVRVSDRLLTCTLPAVLHADTEDSKVSSVLVDGTAVWSITTNWTPYSLQSEILWDFKRGVTQAGTATAIANVGTGGANGNLTPVGAAQAYTAANANLNNQPTITMATGGYKTAGAITFADPTTYFVVAFADSVIANPRAVIIDGSTANSRMFLKHQATNLMMFAGSFFSSAGAWSGATWGVGKWNGATSALNNEATQNTGDVGANAAQSEFTLGEQGDRAATNVFLDPIACAGILNRAMTANELLRFGAFALRRYGIS